MVSDLVSQTDQQIADLPDGSGFFVGGPVYIQILGVEAPNGRCFFFSKAIGKREFSQLNLLSSMFWEKAIPTGNFWAAILKFVPSSCNSLAILRVNAIHPHGGRLPEIMLAKTQKLSERIVENAKPTIPTPKRRSAWHLIKDNPGLGKACFQLLAVENLWCGHARSVRFGFSSRNRPQMVGGHTGDRISKISHQGNGTCLLSRFR